ncbi:isoleucine--tRNA ligase, mitochondrial [Strongylocentrotus purpuratus]|uniref:isoleucine--tRNA ligase n=1 Tax=Strongylocentrotus purpuratus TaxID=7668 RepID=A0A7M7RG77_STRPU|nr:isoleucine--tRNA ligase, mitochondrial [Strongylocentrotus purpuratus]|eukprot:XP_784868.3 PREDICTED: isoleucine--tRNA ligase, mitochondrial [Strongylocentrotus purpuratus]
MQLYKEATRTIQRFKECCGLLRFHQTLRRHKSSRYSDTLNLPNTSFELWGAGKREQSVQSACGFSELYAWQRDSLREKNFTLHDGPPYANGDVHVGHALNKILKDIINRYKLMRGYKVHYVPGWDCHGLPIELKALTESKEDFRKLSALQIRYQARKFALKAIESQMTAFKRWGIMADWDNCYYTFDKEYEASQLQLFHDMYQKGFIYRDVKPVNWSPSSRTALAEAELEYNPHHISPAIYVKFSIHAPSTLLADALGNTDNAAVVIWTTTPWTIPANQAVCYMADKDYCLLECKGTDDRLIIASDRVADLKEVWGRDLRIITTFSGRCLEGCSLYHPLDPCHHVPLLAANHVKMGLGTGLIHTAPAHGAEDYGVAIQHNLKVTCQVDSEGFYTDDLREELRGKNVLLDANQTVIDMLASSKNLLHQEDYEHSYPYDWRTKKPIIIRASKQWFINTASLRDTASECLDEIDMRPVYGRATMRTQLAARTFWCISRQRVWGVPIPVVYNKHTDEPILTKELVDHVTDLVMHHGSDCWWKLSKDQIVPQNILNQFDLCLDDVVLGEDILDIWFDSGTSWSHVLKDAGHQADVYIEGEDQYGAWFQTSLLTSVAAQGTAPYRSVLVHGFALDAEGRKMSKSLGNVVNPDVIVGGGKNKKKEPAYGADVLRWRMADSDWMGRINVGPDLFAMTNQNIIKLRNTFRYFLGNLSDFKPSEGAVETTPLDRYMLHLLHEYSDHVTRAYEDYEFSEVTRSAMDLVHNKISSFYLETVKDRLYCERGDSEKRRSCQTVLHHMLEVISRSLAPIVPHLAEEVHLHYSKQQEGAGSVFKSGWMTPDPEWYQPHLANQWDALTVLRETYHSAIQAPKSREYDVSIYTQDAQVLHLLQLLQEEETSCESDLSEFLMSSFTTIAMGNPPIDIPDGCKVVSTQLPIPDDLTKLMTCSLVIQPATHFRCNRCRKHTAMEANRLCVRCTSSLTQGWE